VTKQEILEVLMDAGADINEPESAFSYAPPITLSIIYKDLSLCKMLVRLGADPNCSYLERYQSHDFRRSLGSALYKAAEAGPEFVTYLLDEGVELAEQDGMLDAHSPLYPAAASQTPAVLEIFMDYYKTRDRPFPWQEITEWAFLNAREDNIVAIMLREYHLWDYCSSEFHELLFKRAVKKKFAKVMRLFIKQEPQIVHEAWMMEIAVQDALDSTKHKDFVVWFKSLQSQPFSLQLVCRIKILRRLGPQPEALIDQLELPQFLKNLLKTKNLV
jgi:hypothetical protein